MKKIFQSLFVVFCLFITSNQSHAQWIQTNGPYGGTVNCLAVNGTNLFAATDSGLYLSTNSGTSWTQTGLTNTNVQALAVSNDGMSLYAGTYGGVFLFTYNGTNWTTQGNLGLTNTNVQALAVCSDGSLFAGTPGGLFLYNSGTNWNTVTVNTGCLPPDTCSTSVSALAVSGTNLFVGITGYGVFLFTYSGTNWTPQGNIGLTPYYVNALAVSVDNMSLFAGGSGGVFLFTNDGSNNWTETGNIGLTSYHVKTLALSGTNLYAGTSGGAFLFTYTTSWSAAVNIGLTNTNVQALAVSSNGSLFAGTSGGGGFFLYNSGTSWTQLGVTYTDVRALAVTPNEANLFAGSYCGDGVFLSNDKGNTWIQTGLTYTCVRALVFSPDWSLFAGTWSDGVFLTAAYGTTWTRTGLASTEVAGVNALAVVSNTCVFAGADSCVLKYDGNSWSAFNNNLAYSNYAAIVVSPDGTKLFAGNYGAGVFLYDLSTGTGWNQPPSTGLTNTYVQALAVSPNGAGGTNLFAGTSGGVFLSTDNGDNWSPSGLSNTNVHAFAVSGTNVFAGTSDGVFLYDGISNWNQVNTGLTDMTVYALAASGTDLFADGAGGVWKRRLSEMITSTIVLSQPVVGFGSVRADSTKTDTLKMTDSSATPLIIDSVYTGTKWFVAASAHDTVNKADTLRLLVSFTPDTSKSYSDTLYILSNSRNPLTKVPLSGNGTITAVSQDNSGIPKSYGISQNYPNPFNPTTVISYQLAANSMVMLRVYDVLGREVASLEDGYKNAGYYEVRFDGSKLSSGVYLYRLDAVRPDGKKFTDTKRMVLMK